MIERIVLDKALKLLTFFPVVGIVGPRQVGKTTLAKQISNQIGKECLYLDLENPRDDAKLTDPVLFFEYNIDKCIILDEIQRRKELFPILRSMIDLKREPARFVVLGSASPQIIRDSSESLAGRISYIELTPFNLMEIGKDESIFKHWLWGGFPDAFLAPGKDFNFEWYNSFIQTYVERDLPLLGLQASPVLMRKLWQILASFNGNVLNKSTLTKSLEISSPTLTKYLTFLEEAFIIRLLKPFYTNIKKRLVKSPKVYIRDSGLLINLLNINDSVELQGHYLVGLIWESYVLEQIIPVLKPGYSSFFYRTQDGAECDLVITKGEKVVAAVEIKYTSTPRITKSLLNSINDLNSSQNFVVTPNSDDFLLTTEIRACNLSDFLTKYFGKI